LTRKLPRDVLALRNAIAELLQDPERRASMAQTSRRIALEEYRLDIQARRYTKVYEMLLSKKYDAGRHGKRKSH
jgi:glycosyltransferase involved in cell wall biosynthesis